MASPSHDEDLLPDALQIGVATGGALLIGVLYGVLPETLTIGPNWLLLVIEAVLLAPVLIMGAILRRAMPYRMARGLALGLLAVVTAALIGSVILLITHLGEFQRAAQLLPSAAMVWGINILVFATWYWEIDGGGPRSRLIAGHQAADFQFPQQLGGNTSGWAPGFIDYLFLAFCSATALSPADTMPLARRAKLLMMCQALISLLILLLLVARAVNIG
ncbi:MAG TPA: hypothetical protein VFU32_03505 [Ktedonobacterales bacterium]|nr:hypothetical protein [Ktedonobacterales bacterium]